MDENIPMKEIRKDVLKFTDAYFNDDFDRIMWRINGLLDDGQPAVVPLLYASSLVKAYSRGKDAYQKAISLIGVIDKDSIEAKLPGIMSFAEKADPKEYNGNLRSFPGQVEKIISKILNSGTDEAKSIARNEALALKVVGSTLDEMVSLRKNGDFESADGLEEVLHLMIAVFPSILDTVPIAKLKGESRQALDRLIGDINEARGAQEKLALRPLPWVKKYPIMKSTAAALLATGKSLRNLLWN